MSTNARARRLLRRDAVFELALGLALLTGRASGLDETLRLPRPASGPVTAAFGRALLPAAALLWCESNAPARGRLQALAAINGLSGALFAGWLAARRQETGALGAMLVGATAAALMALAAAEARVAPRLP